MKVIFVCTGNTCRSPMAQMIAQEKIKNHSFSSAGIYAANGEEASYGAQNAMEIMFSKPLIHKSTLITKDIFDSNDLVIAISGRHKALLEALYGKSDKIIAMPEDIADPFGGDVDDYLASARDIERGIDILQSRGYFDDK
ncbi:MAG: low molecular weight protein arginine phosphatase [Ruminococcaceae bacterium]|nr:low molecular weight protein arginine phosphatase [Oscillospiraceae bacterium]